MDLQTRFGASEFDPLSSTRMAAIEPVRQLQNAPSTPIYVFDACQVGVILRAVLGVEILLGIAVMYSAADVRAWLRQFALLTGGVLPATLLWLIVCCALKKVLQRLSTPQKLMAGALLGALSGLYACGMLAVIGGFVHTAPWLASAASGALIAYALVNALLVRASRRQPASDAARLTELQSRIRPHFLFNTLNSAIALVRHQPRQAEAILEDLSELFRSALVDRGESASLAHEIELAKRYLAIEQVRFGERLRVTWAIDETTLNALLPPLALQPLVENAVKHGVEPSASGADIKVSTERRTGIVVIKITNTAPAGQGHAGHGVALDNVEERLRLLHDVQASFRCTWIGNIYQVRLEIPA